jgi:hypothetical protein
MNFLLKGDFMYDALIVAAVLNVPAVRDTKIN